MATVSAVNFAKQADPSSDNILAQGLNGGRVRVAHDTYTFTEDGAGEVVKIAQLPIGAKVLAIEVINAALGTGCTIGIGYGASGVEFLAQTAVATAGQIKSNLLSGFEVTTVANGVIILTTAGATVNGAIITDVYFTTD
jgi:hypothetical protein